MEKNHNRSRTNETQESCLFIQFNFLEMKPCFTYCNHIRIAEVLCLSNRALTISKLGTGCMRDFKESFNIGELLMSTYPYACHVIEIIKYPVSANI